MLEKEIYILAVSKTHKKVFLSTINNENIVELNDSENLTINNRYTLQSVLTNKLTDFDKQKLTNVIIVMNYNFYNPEYRQSCKIPITNKKANNQTI